MGALPSDHHRGSVLRGFDPTGASLVDAETAVVGDVVAFEIVEVNEPISTVETVSGRYHDLTPGTVVLGCVGYRPAIKVLDGGVPDGGLDLSSGSLALLVQSGMIGELRSTAPGVRPTTVRPLGVLQREGRPSNVAREPDETVDYPEVDVPLVVVAGTSMESGKTSAAAAAVAALASNHRVAGVKLTGTALRKDIERLSEAGADVTADFSDAGILCTKTAAETRHAIGTILPEVEQSVDVIVAELGGGIITFGPEHALASRLTEQIDLFVFAAGDEVAAAGGVCILRDQYGVDPDAIVGPACDTALGRERIAERTGVETVATVDEASRRSFRRLVVARIDA